MPVLQELLIALGYKVDTKPLDDATKGATEQADKVEGAWSKIGPAVSKGLLGIGAALGTVTTAAVALTAKTIENGVEIDTWRKKLSVTAVELGRVQEAGKGLNIEVDNTREAVKTLRENLGEMERIGTGPAVDSLGSLGLKLEDIINLPLEKQLGVLSDALMGVEDHSKRLSIAIELMGEDGAALLPLLQEGSEGIRKLGDAAQRSGRVMDDDMVDTTVRLSKTLDEVRGAAGAVALEIVDELLPGAEDIGEATSKWIDENQELLKQDIPELIRSIASAARVLAEAMGDVVGMFNDAREAMGQFGDELAQWNNNAIIDSAVHRGEISAESAEASKNVVGTRGVAGIAGDSPQRRAARARAAARRRAEEQAMAAAQSAQLTADLATTDQARLDALSRGDRMARQRRRGRSFERGERSKGAGGGGSGVDAAALEEAELMFGDMLRERGYQAGATDMAIKQAIEAAAKSFAEGGNEKVARDAALSKLSSLTGADFKSATVKDPFLAELLGDQPLGVPMMRLSDATGGHEPQVLTQINNITNNWEIDFNVDGAGDAAAAVDGIRQIIREEFTSVAGESARSQQVNFPR